MKTEKNIWIAFILNLGFSVFEFLGGMFTGSVAIMSDALHDLGDAAGIGAAWFLEKKSKRQPDDIYTYGYLRYSVLGSLITTLILIAGSVLVICNALERLRNPVEIHYDGMILLAVIGAGMNLAAAWFTREGDSLNQKAVNLHMLEDVLGWVIVLAGAIVMRFTDIAVMDPLLSMGVALFILVNAVKNLKEVGELFLEKVPHGVQIGEIRSRLGQIEGVQNVHHIHIRSIDGHRHYASMHVVAEGDAHKVKDRIRKALAQWEIVHVTLELEAPGEHCHERYCHITHDSHGGLDHLHHH